MCELIEFWSIACSGEHERKYFYIQYSIVPEEAGKISFENCLDYFCYADSKHFKIHQHTKQKVRKKTIHLVRLSL
jgi:hypothetical protein